MDELPQLLNACPGDMSLVGPRPALPDEAETAEHIRRGLVVESGLTGLRQVSGRSDLSWEESVRLGLRHVGELVVRLTCRSCGKPYSAVLWGAGAY